MDELAWAYLYGVVYGMPENVVNTINHFMSEINESSNDE